MLRYTNRNFFVFIFCATVAVSLVAGQKFKDGADLKLSLSTDGSYNISVNGHQFLTSAPTFFNVDGETFAGDQLSPNQSFAGSYYDSLGRYQFIKYVYIIPSSKISIEAWIKDYNPKPFATFDVVYVDGAKNTRSKKCVPTKLPFYSCFDETISGFPSFQVKETNGTLGYLNYGGTMVGDTHKKLGIFGSNTPRLNDGINGGPLILFNESGTSLVISPLNNFMASSMWHNNSPGGTVSWGIMGGVKEVPPKYTLRTLILAGNGINKAMKLYGETLRSFYKNESDARIKYQQSDITNNYLGYWTDNGAYYYYNTETQTSYESTFEEVQKCAMLEKIPYKYVQLDSWWYYKGHDAAVKNWTARTDVFPKGIKYLQEKTKWPISAHNRYWSTDTDYAKKNGGKYNFIVESMTSLPDDQQFWIDLLTDAKKWGLILYEQDWLNVQVLHLSALQEDISLGTRWLTQMGTAAEQLGLTIQYCMSLPRHALQSLTIPTVTQARVSNDYHPGNGQWRIGISSMFAHALGLAPFKDTFWTTKTQPGNPRYGVSDEPNHRLEIAVATLSAGPIGPGDKVNHTDVEFLKRCCDTDGTILKGTSPATAIDRQIIKMAIPSAYGPKGEVWTTVIDVQSRSTFVNRSVGILFAADLQEPFTIKWEYMEFPDSVLSDEPNHRLEIAVATLSAGPIGPGDKVNHTDVEFLKRCCDTDGTILKGTSPATAIDRQIIKMAIPSAYGPKGEVWTTVIDVQSRSTFVNRSVGILFAADLQEPFTIKWEYMEFPDSLRDSIIFPLDRPDLWQPFNGSFTLSNCSKTDFCIYYLVSEEPGMNGTQIALLGELDKLIPFSPKRITDIVHAEIDLNVKVRGKPGEEVTMSFLVQRQEIVHTTCIIDADGTAQIMSNRCFS